MQTSGDRHSVRRHPESCRAPELLESCAFLALLKPGLTDLLRPGSLLVQDDIKRIGLDPIPFLSDMVGKSAYIRNFTILAAKCNTTERVRGGGAEAASVNASKYRVAVRCVEI